MLLPKDFWEIKPTPRKGHGVFAKKDIRPGTVIGDYIGKVLRTASDDTVEKDEGLYLMYYHDYASLYPEDIHAPGIHRINHSCTPNAWIYPYKGHTLFFALRHIFVDEEITISYLLAPDTLCKPCPHQCFCESAFCTHSMHVPPNYYKTWRTFYESQTKRTKRQRIQYGKVLPTLTSYPQSIPDHPIYTLIGSFENAPLIQNDSLIPNEHSLRAIIRQTGRRLTYPHSQITIHGFQHGNIITTPS